MPVYYYKPLMKRSERILLTKYFRVSMIETNEWGKRCVASGASVRCDGGGNFETPKIEDMQNLTQSIEFKIQNVIFLHSFSIFVSTYVLIKSVK